MLSAQETSQREHLFIIDGSNRSPWFSSLLQIGSTCMNGPSFWCSCSKSARYWLRHRQSNPTQAQEKKKQGTDQTESPKHISKRQSSFRSPKKLKPNPQRRGLPAYVRRPGGPDLRRHGPRGGEAGVRTVQAVHGGRVGMGPPGCQSGGEGGRSRYGRRGGRRGEDGERCVFIAVSRFLFSVRWQHPFLGKSRQNPAAGTTGYVAASLPLWALGRASPLRACPVGFINPTAAQDTHRPTCHILHYRFYY